MAWSLESLLILLLVGLCAGWLAGLVVRGKRRGVLGNLLVGVIGAFLGSWLLGLLGVAILGGLPGQIVQAFLGALVLLALLNLVRR